MTRGSESIPRFCNKPDFLTPHYSCCKDNELDDKSLLHQDSFKIYPTHNTVGMGNCLQQPGLIRNQRYTQIESFHPLIKFSVP
jgi:hypothetical protein